MDTISRRRPPRWLVVLPVALLAALLVPVLGGVASAQTPSGAVDEAAASGGRLSIAGWASADEVHLYVDGGWLGATRTGGARPDVTARLGLPGDTGYRTSLRYDRPGRHTVCAYGFNGPTSVNPLLGCRAFVVGSDLAQGNLDGAQRPTAASPFVELRGWSTTRVVHVYADGTFAGALTTGRARPDVRAAVGARNAGFAGRIQVPRGASVCAYAVGAGNPLLGCAALAGPTSSDPAVHALALVNQARAQAGAPPLRLDATMSAYALAWSQAMPTAGFRHSGGPYPENVAWWTDASLDAAGGAAALHALWVSSPGHLRQMTDPRFTRIGVGLHRDAGGWYGTLVFA